MNKTKVDLIGSNKTKQDRIRPKWVKWSSTLNPIYSILREPNSKKSYINKLIVIRSIRFYSANPVHFALIWSYSIHFGLIRSSLVQFSLIRSCSVHFVSIQSIWSTSVLFILIQSYSVHFGHLVLFGPLQSILIEFGLLRSTLAHFGAL